MEDINLNNYDCNYEMQYVELMIKILEPYFQFISTNHKDANGRRIKLWLKLKEGEEEIGLININQFINFIHIDFPRIIRERRNEIVKLQYGEEKQYEDFQNDTIRDSMSEEEIKKKKKYYEKLPLEKSEYEKKIRDLDSKILRLDKISKLNTEKHGEIKGVLTFLDIMRNYYIFE